ncbi:hypothetical protein [Nitrospira moscoviensis]|uniref:hypothetical protein n=1 Tax=Nitrospira moscoviensis TaxID=42253 RepID=UPI0011AEBAA3|nr:hypothetical protein [Nitrospira moscoviensis]
MEKALLQDHADGTEGAPWITGRPATIGVRSRSTASPLFIWRSGEEVSDGGHMIVPSIGQTMLSSTNVTASVAIERSGKAHIVPIT